MIWTAPNLSFCNCKQTHVSPHETAKPHNSLAATQPQIAPVQHNFNKTMPGGKATRYFRPGREEKSGWYHLYKLSISILVGGMLLRDIHVWGELFLPGWCSTLTLLLICSTFRRENGSIQIHQLLSLKLTWPLKINGWKMNFLLGRWTSFWFQQGTGITGTDDEKLQPPHR